MSARKPASNEKIRAVIVDILKVSTSADLTVSEAVWCALMAAAGIAIDAPGATPQSAAKSLQAHTDAVIKAITDPQTTFKHVVTDGRTIN